MRSPDRGYFATDEEVRVPRSGLHPLSRGGTYRLTWSVVPFVGDGRSMGGRLW